MGLVMVATAVLAVMVALRALGVSVLRRAQMGRSALVALVALVETLWARTTVEPVVQVVPVSTAGQADSAETQ